MTNSILLTGGTEKSSSLRLLLPSINSWTTMAPSPHALELLPPHALVAIPSSEEVACSRGDDDGRVGALEMIGREERLYGLVRQKK
jgi:hypothetical protein